MKIDAEFQSIIPPLTFEEKKMLEKHIERGVQRCHCVMGRYNH